MCPARRTAPASRGSPARPGRVPEDVAAGGFDDSPAAPATLPPLSTFRRPWDRISAEMVRLLLARSTGGEPSGVILQTEPVRRASA